jgi:hypothetical protein
MAKTSPIEEGVGPVRRRELPLPFVGSLAAALFVAMKVGAVSKWNPSTGLALVNSVGIVAVITGILLTQLPLIIFQLGFIAVMWISYRNPEESPDQLPGAVFLAGCALGSLGALLLRPFLIGVFAWMLLVFTAAFSFYMRRRIMRRSSRAAEGFRGIRQLVVYFWLGLLGFFVIVGATTTDVWLPPEIVDLGQAHPVVGYVASSDSEWTTILIDRGRRILRVRSSAIRSRQICDLRKPFGRSIMEVWLGSADNPRCFPDPPNVRTTERPQPP